MNNHFICPCCGFNGLVLPPYRMLILPVLVRALQPPYFYFFGDPSYDVCPCCGYEFGNDDEPGIGKSVCFDEYFEEWVRNGCHWFLPEMKPKIWSITTQVKGLQILQTEDEVKQYKTQIASMELNTKEVRKKE